MKKITIISTVVLFLFSCSKRTTIEQVDSDLKGMLENKVEVQNLEIKKNSLFRKRIGITQCLF